MELSHSVPPLFLVLSLQTPKSSLVRLEEINEKGTQQGWAESVAFTTASANGG